MTRIAILVHQKHRFTRDGSLLGQIAAIWHENGIEITVLNGPDKRADADAVILHVDQTKVPRAYLDACRTYPAAINARVTDISKRRISRNLVKLGDGYDGPVMIKTARNFGGTAEMELAENSGFLRRGAAALRNRLPWSLRSHLTHYPVLPSPRTVPAAVWFNRDLVVERFLPEREGDKYCVRTWIFFGRKERFGRFFSDHPIVKSHSITGREKLDHVPDDLRRMRSELGFDYGKFDFAVVEGQTVLYDANRTPTMGDLPIEEYRHWLGDIADGIWDFLPRPG